MKVGFFGKLPGYGDFIQRNVDPAIIDYWDNWIIQAITNSQVELQESWKDIFFTSPIWRFHFDSRIVNTGTLSGLMMPSVDSAGRCYPFFVICEFDSNIDIFKLASKIDMCHAKCEEYLVHLLNKRRPDLEGVSNELSQFYKVLEHCYFPQVEENEAKAHNVIFHIDALQQEPLSSINEKFLSYLVEQECSPLTIWSRAESESFPSQFRYYQGMPTAQTFTSFLGD